MLAAPVNYLQTIVSNAGDDKDLSKVILHFISICDSDLHFVVNEKQLAAPEKIICHLCLNNQSSPNKQFNYKLGQKLISKRHPNSVYTLTRLHPTPSLQNNTSLIEKANLDLYIPLSKKKVERAGIIKNRITEFEKISRAQTQSEFFNNEKLLVVANQNIFNGIPKEYPACFVSEIENREAQIKYNSPLLPKIAVLKNINLLDRYLEEEINGENITFQTCIFIGSSKFRHSINAIKNCYNQKIIPRIIFIGADDAKINLGNNQVPLRWKWTIPEINYFNNKNSVEHEFLTIQNNELENAIKQFYDLIHEIENQYTIKLNSLLRFVRRLYYDWSLTLQSNRKKLNVIATEFELALKELLQETFFDIDPEYDIQEHLQSLSDGFTEIINTVKTNNKSEKIKFYPKKINQLVAPSFKRKSYQNELNQIFNRAKKHTTTIKLENLQDLAAINQQHWSNPELNFYALIGGQSKSQVVSFSKSDDTNDNRKIVTSIYGSGKIERLIERLLNANSAYHFLLYEIEETAFKYHLDKYVEALNIEYASTDREQICGIGFQDNYYRFSTFDHLIEALSATQPDFRETSSYKITFSDKTVVKLPSSKSVLQVNGTEKDVVKVEELDVKDKVQVYENPDKETLRTIFELKYPELIRKADEYTQLWQDCLLDYYQNNLITEQEFYKHLVQNGFSVSINTMRRYMERKVSFPRRKIDLIAIAKTVNDERLSFDFVRNTMLPTIHDFNGKMIEYGFKFSESINHYLTTGEMDDFVSEWYKPEEIEKIAFQIPVKTIKEIELITTNDKTDD
jgi:hypothetical protein